MIDRNESITSRLLPSVGLFHHSSGVVPSFHIPIVGKSDRCQLAVLQGMLQTPDDDGGTDDNLALTKNENKEIEQVRNKSTRNAIFLTVLFIFGGMLYRVAQGDLLSVDSSSFLIFLILNVLCLEFGIKKATVDRLFKRNGR